jgi:hypothetical protein
LADIDSRTNPFPFDRKKGIFGSLTFSLKKWGSRKELLSLHHFVSKTQIHVQPKKLFFFWTEIAEEKHEKVGCYNFHRKNISIKILLKIYWFKFISFLCRKECEQKLVNLRQINKLLSWWESTFGSNGL